MRAQALFLWFVVPVCLLAQPQAAWVDPSPHTARISEVEPGTSIEVLDWGGSGRTLVLLAQLGQTAHIYDDWAPRLARSYRVLGITRRGHGESATPPDASLSTERLGADIIAIIDALKVPSPVLVGHAFAGEEMSWIGSRHSGRVAGLIYLDAAYNRTNVAEEAAIARRIPVTRSDAARGHGERPLAGAVDVSGPRISITGERSPTDRAVRTRWSCRG